MRLALDAVAYSYGRRPALTDVTMPETGGVVGVIGPNGSGKSTLMKVVAGVLAGDGTITAVADDGRRLRRSELRDHLGYVPQEIPGAVALTVLECVVVGLRRRTAWRTSRSEIDAACSALEELGIAHLADRYLGELSGGQRQLVGIVQTTVRRPAVMLLDEPTSALDLHHQLRVLDFVRHRTAATGGTTLVPLHDLNLAARHCDHLLVLAEGRTVAFGPPSEVLTPQLLAQTYHVEARVLMDEEVPVVTAAGLAAP